MNENALARIQSSLRAAASRGRELARPGPFLVTLAPASDNPYLNYAIPDEGANPTPEDVAALVAAFGPKKPRLEYVPQLAPKVEPALLAADFAVETRTPLMVYRGGEGKAEGRGPEGFDLLEPHTIDETRDLVAALNEAYGGVPPTDEEVARQHDRLQKGTIALLARESATGERAGGGLVAPPEDGLAEVAGIGVRLAYRRRGLARTIVARLTDLALRRGVELPFLMAASEDEARIYARAGYETIGEVLHVSR